MRVATWNINNVNKRLALLLAWLDRTRPDVVALQEIKCATTDFPTAALHKAGYSALVVGQRTWNGVAILSRDNEPLPVATALPGDSADKEARYLEAAIGGVLFACLYLPNGNPQPGPKFDYKLRWFDRLRHRTQELWNSGYPVVLLGDWNVVPTDADIYKPDSWRDDALLQPAPRAAYASILAQGWTDAIGKVHQKKVPFTFWDYRRKRWERDAGLRIDHILVGPSLKLVDAGVDREERGREGPSDHAPVWAQLTVKAPARRKSAAPAAKSSAAKPEAPSVSPASSEGPEPLAKYNEKRDFSKTAEPAGRTPKRKLAPSLWPGHDPLLAIGSADALMSAAQMNVVEFHTWNSKVARIDQPDRFILDLDPGDGVTWQMLQEAAQLTRVVLTELGLQSWLKTSGGKGLHVVVPITPKLAYPEIKAFSQAVVKHMARVIPSKFVAVMGGKNRVGKIFIDYLRNGHGQTTACAFSARSRPGMGVSMPVAWEQLKELKSGAQWNIATAREYLSCQQDDPWAKFWKKRQSIEKGIKILAQTPR